MLHSDADSGFISTGDRRGFGDVASILQLLLCPLFNIINKSPGMGKIDLSLFLSTSAVVSSAQSTSLHNLAGLIKFEFPSLIHSI